MGFLAWFGRGPEKERAYTRLAKARERYGDEGDRVIKLSARTDIARKAAGSTKAAFDYVERAFVSATEEYAQIAELLDGLEADLANGRTDKFAGVDSALTRVATKLDDLDRHLTDWEAKWQEIPRQVEAARASLASLQQEAEAAAKALGAPLPFAPKLATMAQHLTKVGDTLAGGNPVEAGHLLDDLQLAMKKVASEVSAYAGGVGAIVQAEAEVANARSRLAARTESPAEAQAACTAAEDLLSLLRPALAAGKLEQFQQDLLQLQSHLRNTRT